MKSCDWLDRKNSANGSRTDARAVLPQVNLLSGWRSVAAGRQLDPLPADCCRACVVNARGDHFEESCNCICSFEHPLRSTLQLILLTLSKLSEFCSRVSSILMAVWARMRHRDRSATSLACSRITAVECMSSLGSGPHCGAPKWAGSGSHDLLVSELENWNRSAPTGGVQ